MDEWWADVERGFDAEGLVAMPDTEGLRPRPSTQVAAFLMDRGVPGSDAAA
ncbi:MAG: hypothetical protein IH942_08675 [Acidobacteria bacterium]|nr:hypothetical protein [Acidobacteriota bacterium]